METTTILNERENTGLLSANPTGPGHPSGLLERRFKLSAVRDGIRLPTTNQPCVR